MSRSSSNLPAPTSGEIILYQTEDGRTRIQCRFEGETIWLTQKRMAELFQKDVRTINEHIQNVFEEGELQRGATIREFRIVQASSCQRHAQNFRANVPCPMGEEG